MTTLLLTMTWPGMIYVLVMCLIFGCGILAGLLHPQQLNGRRRR